MSEEVKKAGRPRKAAIHKVVKKNVSFNFGNHRYILKILEERKMEVKGHFSTIMNEIIGDHLKVRRYKDAEAAKLKAKLGDLE